VTTHADTYGAIHPTGSATVATQAQASHSNCELRSIQGDSTCV